MDPMGFTKKIPHKQAFDSPNIGNCLIPPIPIASMGLVYLPTFTIQIHHSCIGIHASPMDPMGNSTTPWKINMEPENDGLEYDFPFQIG